MIEDSLLIGSHHSVSSAPIIIRVRLSDQEYAWRMQYTIDSVADLFATALAVNPLGTSMVAYFARRNTGQYAIDHYMLAVDPSDGSL